MKQQSSSRQRPNQDDFEFHLNALSEQYQEISEDLEILAKEKLTGKVGERFAKLVEKSSEVGIGIEEVKTRHRSAIMVPKN